MGAHDFQSSIRAKNMKEAYSQLVEYAIEEHGNDAYNGTISTTRGFKDVTSNFKSSKMSINEFIDKHIDYCDKWGDAWGVCIEEPVKNNLKVKTQVTHSVSKGTKKWVLKYVVYQYDTKIGSKDTKGDAVKLAREYTEKHGKRTTIMMEKVLESGSNLVAEVTYKSSNKEKDGKYVFFGMAAC